MTEGSLAAPSGDPPCAVVLWLATAYQASRALHVAVRLGVPDLLRDGPSSAGDLAAATGVHEPSLRRLLRTLSAFRVLVEHEDGTFALGPLGDCLQADVPGSVRSLVLMYGHEDYWRTWGELEHCVRTGKTAVEHLFGPGDAFARYAADAALGTAMNEGLTDLSATVAQTVVAAYDFSNANRLVDVGGGQGQLLAAILRANPTLRGTLFDLPFVVEAAPRVLADAGVADRCEVIAGDMFTGVPPGGDLYLLSRVLNSFDDERSAMVLASCRRAMRDSCSKLLLAERVLPQRVDPTPAAQSRLLADLNMLVRTGGRDRSEIEFCELLTAAGLALSRVIVTGGAVSLIEAVPR